MLFCLFFCPSPEQKVPSMMRLHLPEESLFYQLKMKNHFSGYLEINCLSKPSKNLLDIIQVGCSVPSGREGCKRIPNTLRRHLLVKTLCCMFLMGSQVTSFKMPDGKMYSFLKVHTYSYNRTMILIFSNVLIFCLLNQFMFIMHLSVN